MIVKQSKKSGFTLIELLLYISLAAFILLVISGFFVLTLQTRIKNQTVAEVEGQGEHIMQMITQTIRNANSITSPATGSSAASLSLATASGTTTFDLSGNTISINEGSGAIDLNSSKITASDLNFTNLSLADTPGTVRVQFTLTYTNSSGRNEYDFNKTFIGSASLRK